MHLHGDADEVAPLETNSGELRRPYEDRYDELGGKMELVVIKGEGHEFAPEYWKNPPQTVPIYSLPGIPPCRNWKAAGN